MKAIALIITFLAIIGVSRGVKCAEPPQPTFDEQIKEVTVPPEYRRVVYPTDTQCVKHLIYAGQPRHYALYLCNGVPK